MMPATCSGPSVALSPSLADWHFPDHLDGASQLDALYTSPQIVKLQPFVEARSLRHKRVFLTQVLMTIR